MIMSAAGAGCNASETAKCVGFSPITMSGVSKMRIDAYIEIWVTMNEKLYFDATWLGIPKEPVPTRLKQMSCLFASKNVDSLQRMSAKPKNFEREVEQKGEIACER